MRPRHVIIGSGSLKGLKVKVPAGARPTTARAREAIACSLTPDFHGATVLDLYCGSGAMGLEALSRGAAKVILVDSSKTVVDEARQNVKAAAARGVTGAMACQRRLPQGLGELLRQHKPKFVWADPPYDMPREDLATLLLELSHRVESGAVVSLECPRRNAEEIIGLAPPSLVLSRQRTFADSTIITWRCP